MKLLALQILLLFSLSGLGQIVSLPEGTPVFEKPDRFSNLLELRSGNVEAVSSPKRAFSVRHPLAWQIFKLSDQCATTIVGGRYSRINMCKK